MIQIKKLLLEISNKEIVTRLLKKINDKQYTRINAGDNGIVYQINNEDYVFKITTEPAEFEVTSKLVGKDFTCFIPILYANDKQQLFIMPNANNISTQTENVINNFLERYTKFALNADSEVSIFDFLHNGGNSQTDVKLVNFLITLQQEIQQLNITDLELELDFNSSNVMNYNGRLVLVDW